MIKFTNNASGTLAVSLGTTDTAISLSAGHGALFPSLVAGDYFYATLADASNNLEVVKVTARATDQLTVVRAQDGTVARSFSAGDTIQQRISAAALMELIAQNLTADDIATKLGYTPASTTGDNATGTWAIGISGRAANADNADLAADATKWGGATKTVSTAAPSGGVDGDIWFQLET